MVDQKRFLVDVGMHGVPFPIRVVSKSQSEGQQTIATISMSARIMQDFEARSIDSFIQIMHQHRERIGTSTLRTNIVDYLKKLQATTVRVDFEYPYFIEKLTPVSKEKCLVQYICMYSAKYPSIKDNARILFKINIPAITTYPTALLNGKGGLFAQLSMVTIETESDKDIYPEDLVDIVDKHALAPVYSFLTADDQRYIIEKVHSENKTSVVMTDEIKNDLAHNKTIEWYSVRCANFGMLHSYSTVIGTEKSSWVPFSGFEDYEI